MYEGIVEVVAAHSTSYAHHYLALGYQLLDIGPFTSSAKHPEKGGYFVRRRQGFIVGRTADVPHVDGPAWAKREDEETREAPEKSKDGD